MLRDLGMGLGGTEGENMNTRKCMMSMFTVLIVAIHMLKMQFTMPITPQ